MNPKTTAYYADCDQFDNARTGFHSTPEEAEAAFWEENTFADQERARVRVYTREVTIGPEEIETARYLVTKGITSPAIDWVAAARSYFAYIRSEPEAENWIKAACDCRVVSIDQDGSVWIADPQAGHWLSDDKLVWLAQTIESGV